MQERNRIKRAISLLILIAVMLVSIGAIFADGPDASNGIEAINAVENLEDQDRDIDEDVDLVEDEQAEDGQDEEDIEDKEDDNIEEEEGKEEDIDEDLKEDEDLEEDKEEDLEETEEEEDKEETEDEALAFSDIQGHWAYDRILVWAENDVLRGYPDGSFKPENKITRGEFMAIVNKAMGYIEEAEIAYSDVEEDAWYAKHVARAEAAAYISGYEDGTMKPEGFITREEVASIIRKVAGLDQDQEGGQVFTDEISDWAKGHVGALAAGRYMNGYIDNDGVRTFGAKNDIKRAEAVVVIDNLFRELEEEKTDENIDDIVEEDEEDVEDQEKEETEEREEVEEDEETKEDGETQEEIEDEDKETQENADEGSEKDDEENQDGDQDSPVENDEKTEE